MKLPLTVTLAFCLIGAGPACTWIDDATFSDRMDLDRDGELGTTDCDDNDPTVQILSWYSDVDGDGYGSTVSVVQQCDQPIGYVSLAGDCDDGDANVSPGVEEICNGFDDDCNDEIDDALDQVTLWPDEDGDGYGDPDGKSYDDCDIYDGYIDNEDDCDDDDESIGAETTYYPDADGDGYGDPSEPETSCADLTTSGFTLEDGALDCDDSLDHVNPDRPEICDDSDNDEDCDGFSDDDDVDGAYFPLRWYPDEDGDGLGSATSLAQWSCDGTIGGTSTYVDNTTDCDDADASGIPCLWAWKYVATGKQQTCALGNQGAAHCWGAGSLDGHAGPFESVATGDQWACGLSRDGAITCWSGNTPPDDASLVPEDLDGQRVVAFASGFGDTCAATEYGEVHCWGNSDTLNTDAPQGYYSALTAYAALFCGTRAEDNAVDCWGRELGIIPTEEGGQISWIQPMDRVDAGSSSLENGNSTICGITTAGHHPVCLTNESKPGWGLEFTTTVLHVSVGGAMACTIDQDNSLTCVSGETTSSKNNPYVDTPVPADPLAAFIRVSAGYDHGCALTSTGKIGCWGDNDENQLEVPAWEIQE